MRSTPFSRSILNFLILAAVLLTAFAPAPESPPQNGATPRQAALTQISFVPNIETVGVVVSGVNLSKTAQLYYRSTGEQAN